MKQKVLHTIEELYHCGNFGYVLFQSVIDPQIIDLQQSRPLMA